MYNYGHSMPPEASIWCVERHVQGVTYPNSCRMVGLTVLHLPLRGCPPGTRVTVGLTCMALCELFEHLALVQKKVLAGLCMWSMGGGHG